MEADVSGKSESIEMEDETESFIENQQGNEVEKDSPGYIHFPRHRISGIILSIVAAIVSLEVVLHLSSRFRVEVEDVSLPVDESPVVAVEPQVHYNANGKKCFESDQELKDAVDSYVLNKENETLAEIYGLPIGVWCVKFVEDFSFLFAPERNGLLADFNDDISGWDMSSALSLERMFRGATWFNQDLSSWNVSNVLSMRGMFGFTRMFDGDIRAWDVSKVTVFAAMFYEADRFNRNIMYWNVSSAVDMLSMFRDARRFNRDLCMWGKQLKTNTDTTGMFFNTACPPESITSPILNDPTRVPGPFCHQCY